MVAKRDSYLIFLLIISWISGLSYSYNVQRVITEDERSASPIYQIDINYDASRFIDAIRQQELAESDYPKSSNVGVTTQASSSGTNGRFFLYYNVDHLHKGNDTGGEDPTSLDSWSVVWYIASFGGLIVFFLIVSCSEWCCRRVVRTSPGCSRETAAAAAPSAAVAPDTPPPSYDEFAPPSYESICLGRNSGCEKNEYDIYVVPVHALGTIMEDPSRESQHDAPPSYYTASGRDFVPAYPPQTT